VRDARTRAAISRPFRLHPTVLLRAVLERVRFEIPDCPPEQVVRLRQALGVSGTLAQTLVRRGLHDRELARRFLDAGEEHDPRAMAGAAEAAGAMLAHARAGALITVHGDYDVDGICSTALLVRSLRSLGADVDWYLPDRLADGYGLAAGTIERLAARGTRLLVTVDCGITAVDEVARARGLGMDVIVSDHHAPRPDGLLPDAIIVHPVLGGYPCPDLCATGVAYKLAQVIARTAVRCELEPRADLDLVALATIADMVPLLGENRALVRSGLRALASTSKPGLRALMTVARVHPGRVDERAVGFSLAPRLNAAGRLYRPDAGLELVLTADPLRAAQIADELDRVNQERRQTETAVRRQAEVLMARDTDGGVRGARASYVLAGEGWHPGVVGIVASRLADEHRRPVVLIALEGPTARGSGRSVEGFDLLAGLRACEAVLLRYGGHRAAAGVELERGRVGEFADAFEAHARRALAGLDMTPRERVDAVVDGEELGMELAEELALMAPFGMGNPPVSLLLQEARFLDERAMGEGKHVRFTVESRGSRARGVAFGMGPSLRVGEERAADATFTLEVNEYRGVSEPRLILRRLGPCRARPAEVVGDPGRPPTRGGAESTTEAGKESPSGELVLF
jgi:single-stranded-DNA-specific exonuclease